MGQTTPAYRKSNCRWTPTIRGEWTFKGQPQKINKAVRILYRYPVLGPPAGQPPTRPVLYYVEDYLLIGFEGSGAG